MAALESFQVDSGAESPVFLQIHDAVVEAVRGGAAVPGERLPTVRALAAQLQIANNTAAAAYRSLEAAGIIEGRGRAGTFIAFGVNEVEVQAREIATRAVAEIRALGFTPRGAAQLLAHAARAAE